MHNLYIPVVAILVAFAIIFGGQAVLDSQVDDDIESLILRQLDVEGDIELQATKEVQKGYGVCGLYQVVGQDQGALPFYYSKVNERVTLDAESERYRRHCDS
ncbi:MULTISPECIES: hypothetical protein [Salinicola]|uniref:Uncharacterized protein n=1 Tax=Salinicola socius TaxID=404433 RepID=A0A1Q8STJ5_9GAMM|nr:MULTISPECIES: hypothetical protein [Salinicola]OLO04779.1 hypothetical protein BTW07_08285 [Salinicola socius]